jgi:hypothetical protein
MSNIINVGNPVETCLVNIGCDQVIAGYIFYRHSNHLEIISIAGMYSMSSFKKEVIQDLKKQILAWENGEKQQAEKDSMEDEEQRAHYYSGLL